MGRHQRQHAATVKVIDRPNRWEYRVAKELLALDARAEGPLEPANRGELRTEAQQLERRCARIVGHEEAVTEPVGVPLCVPTSQRRRRLGRPIQLKSSFVQANHEWWRAIRIFHEWMGESRDRSLQNLIGLADMAIGPAWPPP